MFKKARYIRWLALLISLTVEAVAFWFGGPAAPEGASLGAAILAKMQSISSWAWLGWASLSMAWLWAELANLVYANGKRIRSLLRRSGHEELVYDTGVHWLVLLRDIRLNQLNDGDKNRLEREIFANDAPRSFAWHAIWQPVRLAAFVLVYYIGWIAWSVATIPEKLGAWSAAMGAAIDEHLVGALAFLAAPLGALAQAAPGWLEAAHGAARTQPLMTFAAIIAAWLALTAAARVLKAVAPAALVLRTAARLAIVAGIFALFATPAFDWLSPLYSAFPHHGVIAAGFFPLTLASAFYFPHILFWSSWRYAIIRDKESRDATLVMVGGVFNDLQQRVNLQRIVDTDIFQPWWHRVFNIGDIELKDMGGGEPAKVRHVARPHKLLEEIREAIRESRRRGASSSGFDDAEAAPLAAVAR